MAMGKVLESLRQSLSGSRPVSPLRRRRSGFKGSSGEGKGGGSFEAPAGEEGGLFFRRWSEFRGSSGEGKGGSWFDAVEMGGGEEEGWVGVDEIPWCARRRLGSLSGISVSW